MSAGQFGLTERAFYRAFPGLSPAGAISIFFFERAEGIPGHTDSGRDKLTEPLESARSVRSGGVSCNYSGRVASLCSSVEGRSSQVWTAPGWRGNSRRVATRWQPCARPVDAVHKAAGHECASRISLLRRNRGPLARLLRSTARTGECPWGSVAAVSLRRKSMIPLDIRDNYAHYNAHADNGMPCQPRKSIPARSSVG